MALPSHEQLVAKYIDLRDQAGVIAARHKEELEGVKANLATLENYFKEDMHASNASSLKYKTGTVIRSLKSTYRAVDRSAFFDWVRETGNISLLDGRLLQSAVKEWTEENKTTPPGVFAESEFSITFRRPRTAIASIEEDN